MTSMLTRKAVLLAKIESSEGVDPSPVPGTDAVLVENLKISPSVNLISTNEVTGSLDGYGDIVGGMSMDITFDVYLKGSGAAGTAPEFGKLLKACGFAEVITASAVPVAAEACAAGGSTTTAVLGASASSTAQTYRGMPVIFTGTVPGTSFISDYTSGKTATLTDTMGGSIVATTNYQIPVNVLYKPASSSIPSIYFYAYTDGLLWKIAGSRGTVKSVITSGGVGKLSFSFKGQFVSKTDSALPTPTYDATRPPVFKNAVLLMNRLAAAINSFNLDFGTTLIQSDNPNALEGYDPTDITERDTTGSMDPKETLVGTRDIMGDFRAGTKRILHGRYGTTTGNKVGITIPQALYTGNTPGDRSGLMIADTPFKATGPDAGAFICFY